MSEKKTYPRGSGARPIGRYAPQPPAHPLADWALWAHMPKAKVREAVLLSLGLEPRPALTSIPYAEPGREFERRLTIAAAHVDMAGPLRPLEPWETLGSLEAVTVGLPEFGVWARAMGWTLPEQFPAMEAAQPPQPAPQAEAPAAGVSGGGAVPAPDPERRLARLRAMGGSATYRRNEWQFTGIKALVDAERNEGRKRRDEKTIRADLREAAEAEREAKRAGHWDGLGG